MKSQRILTLKKCTNLEIPQFLPAIIMRREESANVRIGNDPQSSLPADKVGFTDDRLLESFGPSQVQRSLSGDK
ncbi:MAG: hypothetical protein ACK5HA_18155 [Planctomycetaceae bacterium]